MASPVQSQTGLTFKWKRRVVHSVFAPHPHLCHTPKSALTLLQEIS